jgi:cysteine desulfurase
MIYLDANATSPLKPAVRSAMMEAIERHGNPSSVHRYGRIARRYVEEARAAVAALAGAKPTQVIFTGGGSEANNLILSSHEHIYASAVEHDSVLAAVPEDRRLPVGRDGIVDLERAEAFMRAAAPRGLFSVMLVNNETGIIQPIEQIAAMAAQHGHMLHVDAVQAAGRLPLAFSSMGIEAMTLSAHKIGGPQGVGALIVRDLLNIRPQIRGGGQERNRRAGTENVPGIVGFGIAAQLAADDQRDTMRLAALRDGLQDRLCYIAGDDAHVVGAEAPRVANTLNIALRGVTGEAQVASLDLAGVAVSAGSACSSGKVKSSHVLRAMGYEQDIAGCALRISLGWHTQPLDIDRCADAWQDMYERTKKTRKTQAA